MNRIFIYRRIIKRFIITKIEIDLVLAEDKFNIQELICRDQPDLEVPLFWNSVDHISISIIEEESKFGAG